MNALRMEKLDRGWSAGLAAEPVLLGAEMGRAAVGEYYTGRRVFATRRAKPVRQAPRAAPEADVLVPGNGFSSVPFPDLPDPRRMNPD